LPHAKGAKGAKVQSEKKSDQHDRWMARTELEPGRLSLGNFVALRMTGGVYGVRELFQNWQSAGALF
jgi:hypothetical protein